MTTDQYAEMRAALDAGPTPGPWANHANQVGPISREDDQSYGMLLPIAYIEEYDWPIQRKGNALLIAAAHPEAIRALLAERDRLREQIDKLLAHCPDSECFTCGEIICPHGESFHFHHDGCPACAERAAVTQQEQGK